MTALVVEIVDVQDFAGQQVLNVFHFVDPSGVGDPAVLLSDYVSDVLPLMKVLQDDTLTHTTLRWRTVFPTASLQLEYTTGLPVAGTDPGVALASCVAASFKWILGSGTVNLVGGTLPHIKRGGARIAALDEGNVTGNFTDSLYNTAAAAFVAELLNPGTDAFQLCVVSFLNSSRVRQHTAQQYALVTGSPVPAVSTQNTRKILRGRTS